VLIANALKPAEVTEIALCFELGRATVVVTDDQLSLAIGKRGQNVRLAARLTGWDIDILTPEEFNNGLDTLETALREIEGVDSTVIDQVTAMGMVSVLDVEEVGPEPLINELNMEAERARQIVVRCSEEAKRVAEAQAKKDAQAKLAKEQPAAEPAPADDIAAAGGDALAEPAAASAEPEPPAAPAAEPAAADDTAGPSGDELTDSAESQYTPTTEEEPTQQDPST
jgi:N utilization substance protein A